MLLMKKIFFDVIRRGGKTTTLRYWRGRRLRAGQVHTVPGLGKVRIESVRPVELSELTDADAAADGFETLAQLTETLAAIYPDLGKNPRQAANSDNRTLYAVHFTLLDSEKPGR